MSGVGVSAGVIGLVAMWCNVTPTVEFVAQANNAILPPWLIVWSVALLRVKRAA